MPVDHRKPDEFQVSKVPTLTDCINELGSGKVQKLSKEDGDIDIPESLAPYMRYFRAFLQDCERKNIRELQRLNKASQQQAPSGEVNF